MKLLLVIAFLALVRADDDCDDDGCSGGGGGGFDLSGTSFDVVGADFRDVGSLTGGSSIDFGGNFAGGGTGGSGGSFPALPGSAGFTSASLSGGTFGSPGSSISAAAPLAPGGSGFSSGGPSFVGAAASGALKSSEQVGGGLSIRRPTPNFAGSGLAARFFNGPSNIIRLGSGFVNGIFASRTPGFDGSSFNGGGLRGLRFPRNRNFSGACRFGAGLLNIHGYSSCYYPYNHYHPAYYHSYIPNYYHHSYQYQPFYRYSDIYHSHTNNHNYYYPYYSYYNFPSYNLRPSHRTSSIYYHRLNGGYGSSLKFGSSVSRNGFLRGPGGSGRPRGYRRGSGFRGLGYGSRGGHRGRFNRYGSSLGYGSLLGGRGGAASLGGGVGGYVAGASHSGSANYRSVPDFSYSFGVQDTHSGVDNTRTENRYGDRTEGSYSTLLPDGRKQVVSYWVDGNSGYNADVQYYGVAHHPKSTSGFGYE